ncbi:MAG: right-handed parallel beta-helix repeat-containing protein, partial [Candidatus Kerfeldbacteria bacterium]|nr:right-handed parallel beta-helix repeat-containing protein [Candidatus Kerfeldbacteria bacterium]
MRHGIHNRIQRWISAGIVAGAATWLGWIFVSAQTVCNFTITYLPISISSQGSTYCLASTITGSGQISVLADDITLDGQNRASVVPANIVSGNGKNRLTIKDLKISGGISLNEGNTHQIINTTTDGVTLYNVKNNNIVRSNTINGAFQIYGFFTGPGPLFSDNNVIENNTLTFNGLRSDDSGQQARFFRLSYVRYSDIRNNTVTLTNSQGINLILYDVHYSTFENNTFTMTFCPGCGGMGTNIRDRSSYNTFTGNTFDSGNGGIQINLGCCGSPLPNNNVFRNNKSFARATALYLHSSGPNNQFDHNLFYATTQEAVNFSGIGGDSGSGSAIFTNNTVVADSGVALRNDKAAASTQQVTLKNNILYSRDNYAFSTNTGGVTYTSNYNDFYRTDGGSLISYGAVARTLSSYRQASGQDANSISANPLFVNYATKDFRLNTGSPCLGAGENGVDIGAFTSAGLGCSENWQCGDWSTCTNSQQTRTCTDQNSCGTTNSRPPLTQSCDSTAPTVS